MVAGSGRIWVSVIGANLLSPSSVRRRGPLAFHPEDLSCEPLGVVTAQSREDSDRFGPL
jgi:hypothetical protein